jgi:hypothetical protein
MSEVSIGEAFRDDRAARRYLEAALKDGTLPQNSILPLSKWVQAIYLTDAGRLKIGAEHLAALLGISTGIAMDVIAQLEALDRSPAMVALAKRMARTYGGAAIGSLLGALLLLRQSLQFGGVGLDPALVGLG